MKNPQIAQLLILVHQINESGWRPYLTINPDPSTVMTQPALDLKSYLTDGKLILNVGTEAIEHGFITELEGGWITFTSRFNRRPVTLTIHISAIEAISSPDADDSFVPDEVPDMSYKERDEDKQKRHFDLIKGAARAYNVDQSGDIEIEVIVRGGGLMILPYISSDTEELCYREMTGHEQELSFCPETNTFLPGNFTISSVLVRDSLIHRFLGMSDSVQCVVFDPVLAQVLQENNQAIQDIMRESSIPSTEAPGEPAQIIQFTGTHKEQPTEPQELTDTKHTDNVFDLASYRKK